MFFLVEYLLGLDGKKLPRRIKDTHKTIYLAFIYYYFIKGSELESNSANNSTTNRMSKALAIFKYAQNEALILQRIEKAVNSLKLQREKRHELTYHMNHAAEISEAKNSLLKAAEFRQLIEEYLLARKH